jgi:hypothetical protein
MSDPRNELYGEDVDYAYGWDDDEYDEDDYNGMGDATAEEIAQYVYEQDHQPEETDDGTEID